MRLQPFTDAAITCSKTAREAWLRSFNEDPLNIKRQGTIGFLPTSEGLVRIVGTKNDSLPVSAYGKALNYGAYIRAFDEKYPAAKLNTTV